MAALDVIFRFGRAARAQDLRLVLFAVFLFCERTFQSLLLLFA
jgi:hypothetical protein